MNITAMKELLKKEYGICSEKEFEKAVMEMAGVDIGIFTVPLIRKRGQDEQKDKKDPEVICS